jgi:plastocyanin
MRPRSMVILWVLTVVIILAVGLSVRATEKTSHPAAAPSPATSAPVASPTPAPSPSGGSPASCSPAGTSLSIAAKNVRFDTNCLAAPAGKAFTIAFDNRDPGVRHNVGIYDSGSKELFKGRIVTGPKRTTYRVSALPAGTYRFRCDVHTTMTGTFIVP